MVRVVDATDTVEVYEKGKTLVCNCGQKFGLLFEQQGVKCPNCGAICEDHCWKKREEESEEKYSGNQAKLGQFQ